MVSLPNWRTNLSQPVRPRLNLEPPWIMCQVVEEWGAEGEWGDVGVQRRRLGGLTQRRQCELGCHPLQPILLHVALIGLMSFWLLRVTALPYWISKEEHRRVFRGKRGTCGGAGGQELGMFLYVSCVGCWDTSRVCTLVMAHVWWVLLALGLSKNYPFPWEKPHFPFIFCTLLQTFLSCLPHAPDYFLLVPHSTPYWFYAPPFAPYIPSDNVPPPHPIPSV